MRMRQLWYNRSDLDRETAYAYGRQDQKQTRAAWIDPKRIGKTSGDESIIGKETVLTAEPKEDATAGAPAEPLHFSWRDDKNEQLQQERGIRFEQIVEAIRAGHLLDDVPHHNQEQYAHQRLIVVRFQDYVYLVPYVQIENELHLITAFPSRKATRDFLAERRTSDE